MKYTGREWFHPLFNVVPPKCFITDVLGVTTDMEVLSRLNFSWYTLFGTSAASVSNDHIAVAVVPVAALHYWELAREGGTQPIFVPVTRSMEHETHSYTFSCPDPTGTESALIIFLSLSGPIFLMA